MHLTWFTRQYFHCCFCVFGVKPPFVKKCLIEETMTKVKAAKHSHVFTAIVACHRCVGQIMRCYTVHLLGVSVPNIFSQNPYFLKIHSNNCGFFKKVMNAPACWSWGVRWKKYRTLIKHVLFQVCLDTLMLRAPCPDYSSSFVRARKTHWCFQMRTPLPYSTP